MNAMNGHARDTALTLAPFPSLRQEGPVLEWPQPPAGPATETAATAAAEAPARKRRAWPLAAIAAPAAVAIWSGWVGLGAMCGFGLVQPLPGIVPWHLNTAITLPVGIESYGAYALYVWLGESGTGRKTRKFARRSAIGAGVLGCLGQVAFHLMAAAGWARAPWYVVMLVACLPVITLFFAATLTHLIRGDGGDDMTADPVTPVVEPADDSSDDSADDTDALPDPPSPPTDDEPEDDSDGDNTPPLPPPPGPPNPRQPRAAGRAKAVAILKRNPGLSDADVAKRAGVSERTVQRARSELAVPK
jgi:hypothetical protein